MDLKQERKLVEQAQKNPEAFSLLFDIYYDKILNYCAHRTGNIEVARDITSETFFKALKNLWQFHWRNISFSSWIYRIATNEINYFFRKHKYSTVSLELLTEKTGIEFAGDQDIPKELQEAQDSIDQKNNFKKISEYISHLPEKYQNVITLRFFENKKISEIAEILGKKEGTVKSLLSRGLDRLKKDFETNSNKKPMQLFLQLGIIESNGEGHAIEPIITGKKL